MFSNNCSSLPWLPFIWMLLRISFSRRKLVRGLHIPQNFRCILPSLGWPQINHRYFPTNESKSQILFMFVCLFVFFFLFFFCFFQLNLSIASIGVFCFVWRLGKLCNWLYQYLAQEQLNSLSSLPLSSNWFDWTSYIMTRLPPCNRALHWQMLTWFWS